MSKVAIITIHGQGTYKEHSHEEMVNNILKVIKCDKSNIEIFPIKYYSKIQRAQDDLLLRMGRISPKFFSGIREKIIGSFGDTSTIFHNKKEYSIVMSLIKEQFLNAQNFIKDNGSIVVLSHSLGTVLISNYLWDAQKAGIKYKNLKLVVTTGSPLPVFLSGIPINEMVPIDKPNEGFKWINFWNKKDFLSFPYGPLSLQYKSLVEDVEVKKGFFFFSHGNYDDDKNVYKRIANEIDNISK